jgi:hypothetical protein
VNVRFAPLSLDIDQIALSDFFARVIIDPSERINLQDIVRSGPGEQRSLTSEQPQAPAESPRSRAMAQGQGAGATEPPAVVPIVRLFLLATKLGKSADGADQPGQPGAKPGRVEFALK